MAASLTIAAARLASIRASVAASTGSGVSAAVAAGVDGVAVAAAAVAAGVDGMAAAAPSADTGEEASTVVGASARRRLTPLPGDLRTNPSREDCMVRPGLAAEPPSLSRTGGLDRERGGGGGKGVE